MPRKLAAGNWKMNGLSQDRAVIADLADRHADAGVDVLICPPATLISACQSVPLAIGGQDCHAALSGAHTGDISPEMLADAGATYVITGHSERRADHGETDADVAAKTRAAHRAQLTAIVCVGETLSQREAGTTLAVVETQLAGSVKTRQRQIPSSPMSLSGRSAQAKCQHLRKSNKCMPLSGTNLANGFRTGQNLPCYMAGPSKRATRRTSLPCRTSMVRWWAAPASRLMISRLL